MTDKRELGKQERRELARLAHELKPLLQIGHEGLSPSFMRSLDEAFNTRELLKVKMLDTSPDDRRALAEKFNAHPEIVLVQNIGKTFILYKEHEEEGKTAPGNHSEG